MDITDSRLVEASTVPASGAPARRRMSWLQAIGCGALGLVIGYGLAVLATQAPISAVPLIDAASAGPTIAPVTVDRAGVRAGFQRLLVDDPHPDGGHLLPGTDVGLHDVGRDVGHPSRGLRLVDQDRVLRHGHQFPVSGPIAPHATLPRMA